MLSHYNHRYSTYADATQAQLNMGTSPAWLRANSTTRQSKPLARYWVAEEGRRRGRSPPVGIANWFLGWRDITKSGQLRTFIPSVLPKTAVGHKVPHRDDAPSAASASLACRLVFSGIRLRRTCRSSSGPRE